MSRGPEVFTHARDEAQVLIDLQPPECRLGMPSAVAYATKALAEYEATKRSGAERIRDPARWARSRAKHHVFADLLDADDVLARNGRAGNTWVRDVAKQKAAQAFTDASAPEDDELLIAAMAHDALIELAKQVRRRAGNSDVKPIGDPLAYLETIIANSVGEFLAAEREHRDLGTQLVQEAEHQGLEACASEDVGYDTIDIHDLIRLIDRLVAHEPFDDLDRDAWARFKAAGFVMRRMDWGDIPRRRGRDRLHSFVDLLRRVLGIDDG